MRPQIAPPHEYAGKSATASDARIATSIAAPNSVQSSVGRSLHAPSGSAPRNTLNPATANSGPNETRYKSKHERFHDELRHDPSAIRAERGAKRKLGRTALDLAEHEGRDVGAGDQHDHRHRGERREKRGSHAAHDIIAKGRELGVFGSIPLGRIRVLRAE